VDVTGRGAFERQSHEFGSKGVGGANTATAEVHEGLSVQLVPAPFGKRFLAYAVDLGVLGVVLYVVMFILGILAAITVPAFVAVMKQRASAPADGPVRRDHPLRAFFHRHFVGNFHFLSRLFYLLRAQAGGDARKEDIRP